MSQWRSGEPAECGYYMATWLRGAEGVPTVTELWFNPTGFISKWWSARGYLEGEIGSHPIRSVIAWMPKPEPFSQRCPWCLNGTVTTSYKKPGDPREWARHDVCEHCNGRGYAQPQEGNDGK